jgi:translation initiation factor 2-alpha kinase 4
MIVKFFWEKRNIPDQATHKVDNKDYAIKIIKPDSDMDTLEELRREVKNLSQLSHKNVVRYFNSWIETARLPDSKRYLTEEDQSLLEEVSALSQLGYFRSESELKNERGKDEYEVPYLLIQMELCDKRTLRTAIDDNLYKDETKLSKYLTEICEGLAHIHRHNIVHRDIKPENIFLTADDVIKIGDFGLSKQIALVTPEQENSLNHVPGYELAFGSLTGAVGSPFYTAPELYKKNTFNIKADIYSLGASVG